MKTFTMRKYEVVQIKNCHRWVGLRKYRLRNCKNIALTRMEEKNLIENNVRIKWNVKVDFFVSSTIFMEKRINFLCDPYWKSLIFPFTFEKFSSVGVWIRKLKLVQLDAVCSISKSFGIWNWWNINNAPKK